VTFSRKPLFSRHEWRFFRGLLCLLFFLDAFSRVSRVVMNIEKETTTRRSREEKNARSVRERIT